jgi:hypothetical protein
MNHFGNPQSRYLQMLTGANSALGRVASEEPVGCGVPPPSSTPIPTSSTTTVNTHCPTVTSTRTVCSTCPKTTGVAVSTVSNPCDCPEAVPTVFTGWPCELSKCPHQASTYYLSATSTSSCPGRKTTPLADSCTFRPMQTFYSRSGCALPCQTTIGCTADGA